MREGRAKRRREEKQKNRFGESGGPFLCALRVHVRLLRVLRVHYDSASQSLLARVCGIISFPSFISVTFVAVWEEKFRRLI